MSSPAEIVRAYLVRQGLVTLPGEAGQTLPYTQIPNDAALLTPCFVSKVPDAPDQIVSICDVVGRLFLRPMRSARQDKHPGLKFIIRTLDYTGYALANSIGLCLDQLTRTTVTTPDGVDHYLQSVYRTTSIVPMGEEVGKQRELWSFNARVSFQDAEPSLG